MRLSPCDEIVRPHALADCTLGRVRCWPVGNRVGESPAWRQREQALYWIDVRAPQLLRLDPREDRVRRWQLPDVAGALALAAAGRIWLALRHRLVEFDTASGLLRDICAVEPELRTNRLNDGKVSPGGRWFVFGSMDDRARKEPTGGLFRASADGQVRKLRDGLVVANGIAFDAGGTHIFFSDSSRGLVMKAPWNEEAGEMGPDRVIATLDEPAGRPDGAAVDAEGHYWSAGVSAGVLHRLGPDGTVLERHGLAVRAPTMPTFGGAGGRTLFVTSLVRPPWEASPGRDGSLLAIDLAAGVRGGEPTVELL